MHIRTEVKRFLWLAAFAIAALLLAACDFAVEPAAATTGETGFSHVATVEVDADATRAELEARHGGTVLLLDADEGFAILGFNPARGELATQSGEPLEQNRETFNTPMTASGASAWSDGASAWSDGASAWSDGASAWSDGASAWSDGASAWSDGEGIWSGGYGIWDGSEPTWEGDAKTHTPIDNARAWTQIGLGEAHTEHATALGDGIVVAVVDTGLDLAHPAFAGRLVPGWDFIDGDETPQEVGPGAGYGHGTAVAGVILQIAPKASIMPLRVLGPDGVGDTDDLALAIDWAIENGADVINLSLGSDLDAEPVRVVLEKAQNHGVLVVAAAGNSGTTDVHFPAREASSNTAFARSLVSVGSVNVDDGHSIFTNYGDIEMVAPGEFVFTAFPEEQVIYATGTSFSVPMVAAALALALAESDLAVPADDLAESVRQWSTTDLYVRPENQGAYLGMLGDGRLDLEAFLGAALP